MWKILLLATLFNSAFFFSSSFGWVIVIALILLFFLQKKLVYKNSAQNFCAGFFWGIVAFALHFIWLYELLLTKSQASKLLSLVIFVFCVLYFSIFSGLWFLFIRIIFYFSHIFCISFFCSTTIFFWFIEKYSFFIFGRVEGYPFLNPLLPLARYKTFLFLYSLFFFNFPQQHELKDTKIFYLKPVPRAGELSPAVVGQMIYQKLSALNLNQYSAKYKNLIVVAPETSFPFALNKHMEMLNFWNNTLPKNAHLLLGSQREENEKLFQTLFYINSCRIMQFYDKTHKVPFTEKIPKKWKNFNFSRRLFLNGKEEFHKGDLQNKFFKISEEIIIVPRICSDIFFKSIHAPSIKTANFIFVFVNDSWFMNYFKQIMENFVCLKQRQLDIPFLYITHSKALNLGFF